MSSSTDAYRDVRPRDVGLTISPISPYAARLRQLIRGEVANVLRAEREQDKQKQQQGRTRITIVWQVLAVAFLVLFAPQVASWLGLQIKVEWKYSPMNVPSLGDISKMRALFVDLLFRRL